jgi:diguanylate cyclase (GGDEF)-like protein
MTLEPLHPDDLEEPDQATLYTALPAPHGEPGQEDWALIRYVGDPIGEVIPLQAPEMRLGRASDSELYLPEAEVSRHHAILQRVPDESEGSAVCVMDLGSTNGTFVNGHRVETPHAPQRLHAGDVLRVGCHAFKLKRLDPVERHYHETMLAQTTLDGLTGVSNRATVLSFLEKQSDLAARHRRPLAIILCDLDNFKGINDRWGHPAGDEVLRFFGSLLLGRLRASDQVGRIGGEEFLLVLPETSAREAAIVAESLRTNLEAARIPIEASPEPITAACCFGVAQLCERDGGGGSLLARADVALYRAKAEGRNRVEIDDPT